VIDTAGLDAGAKGSLTARMQEQTETAIGLADALMFVIDARSGLTPNDRAFADFARRANNRWCWSPTRAKASRAMPARWKPMRWASASRSRFSAEHGEGLSDLYDALRALMPEPAGAREEFDDDDIVVSDEELASGRFASPLSAVPMPASPR